MQAGAGRRSGSPRVPVRDRIEAERWVLAGLLKTVTSPCSYETRVKGSRFIASIWPVSDVLHVARRLGDLQREYGDATHHCWSYRILAEPHDLRRSSDAGEPAGTAGAPIGQAIDSAGLANVLVVVVRYFGGTKLGRGGLVRAYRNAARGAIAASRQETLRRSRRMKLGGPLKGDGEARHLIARHGGTVARATYEDEGAAVLEVILPVDAAVALLEELRDQTRGGWGLLGIEEGESPREGEAGD